MKLKNKAEAKKCPFCYSKDIKFVYRHDQLEGLCCKVECEMCGATGPEVEVPYADSQENPLNAWNERGC
jgi:Lar family restriction alleviation protein